MHGHVNVKFIVVEFGIFETRNGILCSWKVDFVDYTRNSSVFVPFLFIAFLPLFNYISFMDFQNVFWPKKDLHFCGSAPSNFGIHTTGCSSADLTYTTQNRTTT
jgi:hypothetical protein